jgi:hypothetical protein
MIDRSPAHGALMVCTETRSSQCTSEIARGTLSAYLARHTRAVPVEMTWRHFGQTWPSSGEDSRSEIRAKIHDRIPALRTRAQQTQALLLDLVREQNCQEEVQPLGSEQHD